ncbi:MAG: hypothetical protein AB8B56_05955 [Crocinitomicaceae bacterium]
MKSKLFILLISVLPINVFGQNIDFDIIILDTSEQFNTWSYADSSPDLDVIIDSDSMHRETFRWSTFTVRRPRFREVIWLKRTIHGDCLTGIENIVTIDSSNRTVTWTSAVESANCDSKSTRHIVIQIPKPPDGFEVIFDLKSVRSESEKNTPIHENLEIDALSCQKLFDEHHYYRGPTGVIDNDSLFTIWNKNGMSCEKPDFSKKLLLAGSYGGDCHMKLETHLSFDPITNTMILNVYNIWGGCRAGGSRSFAILVEKPKESFDIVFQEIQVESRSEYDEYTNKTTILNPKE